MKRLLFTIMAISCMGGALNAASSSSEKSDGKVLVAYISFSGNTERIAKSIAQETGGDLYVITPAKAYSAADLDWRDEGSRCSKENANPKARPAIAGESLDIDEYDVVFLGYPIWWGVCPRVVNTFIEKYKFEGKKVIPFATSSSSGIEQSEQQFKSLYPNVDWQSGRRFSGSQTGEAATWAAGLVK